MIPKLGSVMLILGMFGCAYAQTEFMVACQNGICQIKESDLVKLQQIINALVDKLEQLQARGGCT